jgi:hypothetical protein
MLYTSRMGEIIESYEENGKTKEDRAQGQRVPST